MGMKENKIPTFKVKLTLTQSLVKTTKINEKAPTQAFSKLKMKIWL